MSVADYIRRDRDQLDKTLGDLEGLIAALQIIAREMGSVPLERGCEMNELRGAIIGIGDAMEERATRGRGGKA